MTETSHWNENKRVDGVEVRRLMNDCYEIVRRGYPTSDRCICCGAILLTERVAKRVADRMYPLVFGNEPSV